MSNDITVKISELPVADSPTGVEVFPVVQAGVTRKMDLTQIFETLKRNTAKEEFKVEDSPYTFQDIDYDPQSDIIAVFVNGALLQTEDYIANSTSVTLLDTERFEPTDDATVIVTSSGVGVTFTSTGAGAVSVEQYGASASASPAQNYNAITDALTENAGNRMVLLEAMYPVSATILVPSNTHLKGMGRGTGITMPDNVPRDEPVMITGHRLQKGEDIILEDFDIDFNRNRWTLSSGVGSTWNALAPTAPGIRHTSNQNVTQSNLMVCNSERVLVRNIRSVDGYKHCFDVSAPWYGRGANTPDPQNPGEFMRTALQYDPDPAKYIWFEGCEAEGGGDDNFTSHQCSFVWYNNCNVTKTGGVRTGGNSNGFEIDDGSRNVWLTNCVAIGCTDGVQVKGHNDSPAPYNVFMANIMAINCRIGLELRHTGWYGPLEDNEDLEPVEDEDGNPIPILGTSQTARNIQITNYQVIAPRETVTEDGITRSARRGVRIRAYENVSITGLHISDGALDLAKEFDGYLPTTPMTGPVVQINRGIRNLTINDLVINGFASNGNGARIYGTAGDGIDINGFKINNGPRHGLYQSGDAAVSLDNFNFVADQTHIPDSYGVRMTSNPSSFIGRGSVTGYSRPARFGGEEFGELPYAFYQPLFARLGGKFRTTNSNGVDIERSSAAGNGRMLRLQNAGVRNGFLFSTSNAWLACREGQSVVLGYAVGEVAPTETFDVKTYGGAIDNFTQAIIDALSLEIGDSVRITIPSQGWNAVHTVTNITTSSPLGAGLRSVFFSPSLPVTEEFPTYTEYSATFQNLSKAAETGTPESSARRKAVVSVQSNSIAPSAGGAGVGNVSLGRADSRFTEVFATNGTINTSDERMKTQVRTMTADEVNAAKQICQEIGVFKFLDAIEEKGEANAREHIGMTVQRVIEIMEDNNLEPLKYSFICHDSWDETPARFERDEEGNLIEVDPLRPAGDVYSFRYDELNLFIARGFEARIAALENANE